MDTKIDSIIKNRALGSCIRYASSEDAATGGGIIDKEMRAPRNRAASLCAREAFTGTWAYGE